MGLLKLDFAYGGANNNGNVLSQTITVPTTGQTAGFTAVQSYAYDELNRLKSATETIGGAQSWKQTFNYDRYGNRTFDTAQTTTIEASCPQPVCNPQVDPATNRLIGYTFDTAGNTTVDAQGRSFTYNAENRQIEVKNASNITVGEYFYDGDGKRVKKKVGSEVTIFVYDASDKLAAEYATTVAPALQARLSYLTTDHLDSPRITTDANGKVFSRRDFLPFGEEITSAHTAQRNVNLNYGEDGIRQKFTGYLEDFETDLDFAQARMYANNLGRFTATDPVNMTSERLADPQRINLFIYARNNPLKFVDVTGEDIELLGGMTQKELDTFVDAMFESYLTEGGYEFFNEMAKATETLFLGKGDVPGTNGNSAFGLTTLEGNGDIVILLDLDAQATAEKEFQAGQLPPGTSRPAGQSPSSKKKPPTNKENGKHEVAHGIDARENPKEYRKAVKDSEGIKDEKKRPDEKRREKIQEKRVNNVDKKRFPDKESRRKAKEQFKELIGYDKYKF